MTIAPATTLQTSLKAVRPESAEKGAPAPLKLVSVGDSLTAGMQDANLCADRQQHSYSAVIARQAGLEYKQPLIDKQGIPPKFFLSPGTSLARTAFRYAQVAAALAPAVGTMALGFVPPDWALWPLYKVGGMGTLAEKGEFNNFAIPAAELRHLNDVHNVHDFMSEMAQGLHSRTEIAALGPYAKYMLQGGHGRKAGKSEVDLAIAQKPDVMMFWAGNNDILGAAMQGKTDDVALTPIEDKRWTWNDGGKERISKNVMPGLESSLVGPNGSLTRLLNETSAEIFVMNIPDVTVIPNMRNMGEKVGKLPFRLALPDGTDVTARIENWKLPMGVQGEGKDGRTEFPKGTAVGLFTVLKKFTHAFKVTNMHEFDAGMVSMSKNQAAFGEDEVLDPEETAKVRERAAQYNGIIHDAAQKNPRLHEVKIDEVLASAAKDGVVLKGAGPEVIATNTFTGLTDARGYRGIFSGDGIHPSDIGYAVIANKILDRAREDLGSNPRFDALTKAEFVDEKAVLAQDPHNQGRNTLVLHPWVMDRLLASAHP